jgi:hypothetical protein
MSVQSAKVQTYVGQLNTLRHRAYGLALSVLRAALPAEGQRKITISRKCQSEELSDLLLPVTIAT